MEIDDHTLWSPCDVGQFIVTDDGDGLLIWDFDFQRHTSQLLECDETKEPP